MHACPFHVLLCFSLLQNIEVPFLHAVKQVLGDRYSEQMDVIYRIAIHFLLEKLVEQYRLYASHGCPMRTQDHSDDHGGSKAPNGDMHSSATS